MVVLLQPRTEENSTGIPDAADLVPRRLIQTCVPGMVQSLRGESSRARFSRSGRIGERQRLHREVGPGGSPIQKRGTTNRATGGTL
jgi:hypothetical protein